MFYNYIDVFRTQANQVTNHDFGRSILPLIGKLKRTKTNLYTVRAMGDGTAVSMVLCCAVFELCHFG